VVELDVEHSKVVQAHPELLELLDSVGCPEGRGGDRAPMFQ
jgi:hypothetical protein